MAEVLFFQPRSERDAKTNLADFINHCRNNLTLYEDQGGFNVDKWVFEKDNRSYAMVFSKYTEKQDPYNFTPFDEPFLTFAKARIRYSQSQKQVKSIANQMIVLRAIFDGLLEIHGNADILKMDGIVIQKVRELLDLRYPGSDLRYRLGQQLELLYEFLRKKFIVPTLPEWENPWPRGRAKAERTDSESRKWQEERCPSLHQMMAIADCFCKATSNEDLYWSSVLTLLMFAPSRGGEVQPITIDCLHYADNGALGVRWFGEKGFGDTIKWVPEVMRPAVIEAHARLMRIGAPARAAAKFAHEHPDRFYRHEGCITPPDFPENQCLSPLEFAHAMDFGVSKLDLPKDSARSGTKSIGWDRFRSSKWVKKLRENGDPTYRELASHVHRTYQGQNWPNLPGVARPIWESLILIRDREFHTDFNPHQFSWILPNVNQINAQLAPRTGLKNPVKSIFQRFGMKDEDGSEIELTSHQLRVWLSTNAERGGMDSWQLAKWAGRARIQDNSHYDLRTPREREAQLQDIALLSSRPSALEAIKLNLPVSYQDLGLNRIGIAEVTEYGMCTHDYAMSPCSKAGECMTCKEHACIKGMPRTLEAIKRLEEQVASQFEKAKVDAADGAFGADRWETHLGWKLAHIKTQRQLLESDETPLGAILWIPPAHDPSPISRSLEQNGFNIRPESAEIVDELKMANLLGLKSA